MPKCPHCHKYYFGTPEQCPNCLKMLSGYTEASATVQSSSKASATVQGSSKASITVQINRNIGNIVQKLAMIDLVINVIATFIYAFVFGKDFSSYRPQFSFGNFLLILLVGLALSAVLFILLYAYGRMVESSIISAENSEQSLRYLATLAQEQEKAQTIEQEKA